MRNQPHINMSGPLLGAVLLAVFLGFLLIASLARGHEGPKEFMAVAYCLDVPEAEPYLVMIKQAQLEDNLALYKEVMENPIAPCVDVGYYGKGVAVLSILVEEVDRFDGALGCMVHLRIRQAHGVQTAISWEGCPGEGA